MSVADGAFTCAIVGAGPSGFYAAEALLAAVPDISISLVERLPTPFGLVRNGVAPDHPKLRSPIQIYDRIARSPQVTFFGDVEVGRDVTVDELQATHHAMIFAHGASDTRRLGISGEDLPGCHNAASVVGWYNGHPDFAECRFDLSHRVAVIIGQGNVALDVARILMRSPDELRSTDIAEHALAALTASRIEEIHIVGRRGPLDAKFSRPELAELGSIGGWRIALDADQDLSDDLVAPLPERDKREARARLAVLRNFASAPPAGRICRLRFFLHPREITGRERVGVACFGRAVPQAGTEKAAAESIPCGLLITAAGYRGSPVAGLPFDPDAGVVPNVKGAVQDAAGQRMLGLYVAGWIKRGPSGNIGTNRADAVETVATLLDDMAHAPRVEKPGSAGLASLLRQSGRRFVTYDEWGRIDAAELATGQLRGKPRSKIVTRAGLLAAVRANPKP